MREPSSSKGFLKKRIAESSADYRLNHRKLKVRAPCTSQSDPSPVAARWRFVY